MSTSGKRRLSAVAWTFAAEGVLSENQQLKVLRAFTTPCTVRHIPFPMTFHTHEHHPTYPPPHTHTHTRAHTHLLSTIFYVFFCLFVFVFQALMVTCPADIVQQAVAGLNEAAVTFPGGATGVSGGTPPYILLYYPNFGSSKFPVGQTTVTLFALDSAQPRDFELCQFTVTITGKFGCLFVFLFCCD